MAGKDAIDRFGALRLLAQRPHSPSIARLNVSDAARAHDFSLRVGPVYANFARQRYDRELLSHLFSLAAEADVAAGLKALADGEPVNTTEGRPALHTALRGDLSATAAARDARSLAVAAQQDMRRLIAELEDSPVTDIVSVGIGGSDLGPRLAVDALSPAERGRFRLHFLSNVDGHAAQRVVASLDPGRTAALLISKSFGTQETLLNGAIIRDWLRDDSRLFAITAQPERAHAAFAIPAQRVLPMWDWVGGRYSLWSAVGFPIALAIGMPAFEALLAGAAGMDAHVLHAPLNANLAVWHAVTAVFNRNGLGLPTHAVLPYDERLRLLPAYLQQLVMESLGKSVTHAGQPVCTDTVPVWWGGAGTDTQHSFFQALHQGTQTVPCDFIGVLALDDPYRRNHAAMLSNLFAQSEALANGQVSADGHRSYPGNRPSTMLLLDDLSPHSLGALLALYEHSVFIQARIWGINPFDQFGVELGKQVANALLPAIEGEAAVDDVVTRVLVEQLRGRF